MEIMIKRIFSLILAALMTMMVGCDYNGTLNSKESKEKWKAFCELPKDENLEIDFRGVLTLSPSWADEFLSPLLNELGDRLALLPSDNLSVHATLKILAEVNKRPFKIKA